MSHPRFSLLVRCLVVGVLTALSCGCSPKAKKARQQAKADEYFKAGEYDNAEIEYKNLMQMAGLDPWALAQLGIMYFEQGRNVRAGPHLLRSTELQPDNLAARLKLGYLYLAGGKPKDARDAALYILDHNAQDPVAPILLAESTADVRDVTDARARLQLSPESASTLAALGMLELRMRKPKEAEALLERSRQLDPKLTYPLSGLAQIYADRKEIEQAEKTFASAAALSPPRSPVRLQQVQFNLRVGKPEVAKQLLDEMIRTTPDFLPSYVLRADIALNEKKLDEGIGLLEKVLSREPFLPEAMLLVGKAYAEKGEKDKAVAALEKAVAAFPQAPQMHLQLGHAFFSKGDLDRANASFAEAVKYSPGNPAAVMALAQVNILQRNFTAAIAALKDFLKQNPTNGSAYLLLADAFRNQGSLDDALAIYRKLAEPPNRNPQVYLTVGAVLLQQNKKTEARQAFTTAAEIAPDFLPATEQLVNLDLFDKQYSAAQARVEAQVAKDPKNAQAHFLLARIAAAQGANDKAEAALQKAIALDPEAPGAYLMLAQIYLQTDQTDKALTNLQAATAKNPKDFSSALTLGMVQQQKGDLKAARESYERVLAINPKSVGALNNLAYLLAEHFGELDQAVDLAQKARDLSPNRGESADTLGWILYKKGQYARALALLDDSAEKVPDNAEMQYHLGMAHYMMGSEGDAQPILERALKLSPTFPGREDAQAALAVMSLDSKAGAASRPLLEKALARHKDDPVALARLAAIDEREGNVDKALAAYETALKSNPNNVNAAVQAIRLYRQRKESSKALALANATRALAPSDGRVAHALGRLTFENGSRLSSVAVLQDASRRLSGDPEVLFDLGEASYSVGQVEAAEAAWREAVEKSPKFSRVAQATEYLGLIAAARNPAATPGAPALIEQALKSDASSVPALMAKGAIEEQKNDAKAAKQSYEKALARYPEFGPAMKRLTLLYSSQPDDDKKAVEFATKARAAFPNDPELAKAGGIIYFRSGSHSRAATLLQDAARNQPADAAIMYYLGMSQSQLKDQPASRRSLERALELGLSGNMEAEAKKTLATFAAATTK